MHRFYVNQKLEIGEHFVESVQIVHQLSTVLRIRPGEPVIFFDDSGFDYRAEILLYSQGGVHIKILEQKKNNREFPISLIVCHALIKKDLTEFIFEKGTEIGVAAFQPLITTRSIQKEINVERGRKIVKEAAEQSGRARLPRIQEPKLFKNFLQEVRQEDHVLCVVFDASPEHATSYDAFASLFAKKEIEKIFLCIGPEGGFSPEEVAYARTLNVSVVSLYPTILRAETAAIIFPALVLANYIAHESRSDDRND